MGKQVRCKCKKEIDIKFFAQCGEHGRWIKRGRKWERTSNISNLNDLFKVVYGDSLKDLMGVNIWKELGKKLK